MDFHGATPLTNFVALWCEAGDTEWQETHTTTRAEWLRLFAKLKDQGWRPEMIDVE